MVVKLVIIRMKIFDWDIFLRYGFISIGVFVMFMNMLVDIVSDVVFFKFMFFLNMNVKFLVI